MEFDLSFAAIYITLLPPPPQGEKSTNAEWIQVVSIVVASSAEGVLSRLSQHLAIWVILVTDDKLSTGDNSSNGLDEIAGTESAGLNCELRGCAVVDPPTAGLTTGR